MERGLSVSTHLSQLARSGRMRRALGEVSGETSGVPMRQIKRRSYVRYRTNPIVPPLFNESRDFPLSFLDLHCPQNRGGRHERSPLPKVQKAHDGNDRPDWQNPAPLREVRQGRSHENRCGEMGKQWAFRPNERGLKSRFVLKERTEAGLSYSAT